jgi:hypothetical protein
MVHVRKSKKNMPQKAQWGNPSHLGESKPPFAKRKPTTRELYWAAGFLEGEGCFSSYDRGGRVRNMQVTAVQVQRHPLEMLQEIFGGSLKSANYGTCWRWGTYGPRARGVMMTLYKLLSPKRQSAIRLALHG